MFVRSTRANILVTALAKNLAVKLLKSAVECNIKRGKLCQIRERGMLISIKDPFLKGMNHGRQLTPEKHREIV
jgi:hypothetical protein